ncbi:uncharacterized protein N7473_012943 [Penicillium subrubescens]|uniref:Transcription factor TFIIIC triple barrel domain-containing protein n=1 Tax=Penicillium subrubescens TaxID=1316194 RepID=A0A1Q5T6P1_9EURO|nr:uncharacterized protein N7473_012943 [Penicillium subrubescens]KAJ5875596.1 hypothetical protein N7473_012943 [Penicillium subrubescens]OKO95901.1 hypothetical protein PENSUB_10922 [Penicillium subrubescens]
MDQPTDSGEDEWEYEYHETETESFYLNLDLSSVHGPIRPPRRRQQQEDTISSTPNPEEDGLLPSSTPLPNTLENTTTSEPFTPLETTDQEALTNERIQILGLHTCNPIVSYCDQLFSCTWADQIGTELIFSHPDAHVHHNDTSNTGQGQPAPLLQGPSFELLAANSVKILGRKANITSSASSGLVGEVQTGTSTGIATPISADDAQSTPVPATSVPRRAVQPSHQANFLARLQNIKAARGETDTVRTTFSMRRNVNIADRLGAWARTEAQLAEIHSLNDRAHKGDVDAFAELERIMIEFAQRNQQPQQEEQEEQEGSSSFPIDPQLM